MKTNAITEDFFEQKYKQDADPWSFATDSYEDSRYSAILRRIGDRRYKKIYEPGCSIGVFTARLAAIGDRVDAIDISMTAVERARKRCESFRHVFVSRGKLPEDLPEGCYDLIVFSEIGYYFPQDLLFTLATSLLSRLSDGGIFIACHWLGSSPDHILSGDEVHRVLSTIHGMKLENSERYSDFRIDRWGRS